MIIRLWIMREEEDCDVVEMFTMELHGVKDL